MARILPDKEIRPLLEKVIIGGSNDCVRHNSYELRLGNRVKFDSTGEESEIAEDRFLEIQPGDFVTISSWEKLDFSRETLASLGKKTNLTGLVTPTTTMMREGFLFTTTKVDPGFRGQLNWGIRNSSIKPVRLARGERLFKVTLYELAEDEVPEKLYGEDPRDAYQNSHGITASARMIPADIPEAKIVRRTERKIDPNKQLLEAGPPFSHIGTELVKLHGKFEIVSHDVLVLKDDFAKMQTHLEGKIESETKTLSTKLGELSETIESKMRKLIAEQFETFFSQKLIRIYAAFVAIASIGASVYTYVIRSTPAPYQAVVFLGIGLAALILVRLLPTK